MINEIKVTLRNTFMDHLFALESEKESKSDKKTPFRDYPQIPDHSSNP